MLVQRRSVIVLYNGNFRSAFPIPLHVYYLCFVPGPLGGIVSYYSNMRRDKGTGNAYSELYQAKECGATSQIA